MRRRNLLGALALIPLASGPVGADPAPATAGRAQREMQVHQVRELGLEIWVENEPPWQADLQKAKTQQTFVAQSPPEYYPPTVMTYVSLPDSAVDEGGMLRLATTAIRRASENYRVPGAQRVAMHPQPARYGQLSGYEASFDGWANDEAVQVKVFVGHAPGRAPVAMQVYTLPGKLEHLQEPIRRAWTKVKYLK